RLAVNYGTDKPPRGTAFSWQSGYVGLVRYGNVLNIHVAPEGLYLSVMWLFRLGHRPLLLPWDAVHDVQTRQVLWHTLTQFRVGSPSVATVQIPSRVFEAKRAEG